MKHANKRRDPILITQHGVPSAYLVEVETHEALQRGMSLLGGIARGEKAIEDGRTGSSSILPRRREISPVRKTFM